MTYRQFSPAERYMLAALGRQGCNRSELPRPPGGGEGGAELTAARWLPLDDPASWEPELRADPYLHPQPVRIRDAVRAPQPAPSPPAG